MKEQTIMVLTVIVLAAAFYGLDLWRQPVQAATPNGCTVIGTVGNVIVARCIDDETNSVVFVNSAGFMQMEN